MHIAIPSNRMGRSANRLRQRTMSEFGRALRHSGLLAQAECTVRWFALYRWLGRPTCHFTAPVATRKSADFAHILCGPNNSGQLQPLRIARLAKRAAAKPV